MNKLFLFIAFGVVIAVVTGGFLMLGSPGQQRKITADSRRVQDLQNIAQFIYAGVQQQAREPGVSSTTPVSLEAGMSQFEKYVGRTAINDPVTNVAYEYHALGKTAYQLCAVFETDSTLIKSQSGLTRPTSADFWDHPIGRHCFDLNILRSPYGVGYPYDAIKSF